jgi:hypothetical protein
MISKASKSKRQNPDAGLIAMIKRHDVLWAEWDRVAKVDEDDPRIDAYSSEAVELERKILATPAFTDEGLAGKRRVVERAELVEWDYLGIVDTIFALDADRVAAVG